uniref:CD63 antigen-like n=1 Tax=Myxine glutinosa TaxID=7769 RepID=UPI00358EC803
MVLEGGMKIVKYLLFVFNLLFWLSGLVLIIIGAVVQAKVGSSGELGHDVGSGAPILLIVVGSVIFIVAFFGCCGAVRESRCMLGTFIGLLVIILVVEIAAAIAAFVYKDRVKGLVDTELKKSLDSYPTKKKKLIDDLQHDMQCCGAQGYKDYEDLPKWTTKTDVPASCCLDMSNSTCNKGITLQPPQVAEKSVYIRGCSNVVEEFLQTHLKWIAAVLLAIGIAQILGVVLACVLICGIHQAYETF